MENNVQIGKYENEQMMEKNSNSEARSSKEKKCGYRWLSGPMTIGRSQHMLNGG